MGAIPKYSPICPIFNTHRPTEIRSICAKFEENSSLRLDASVISTDGRTDMARSTLLVTLIKNIYSLWGLRSIFRCVTNGMTKLVYPHPMGGGYKNGNTYLWPKGITA